VFWIAGIWGVVVLVPLYFIYDYVGKQDPPPLNHPQFYYGFVGVGLAWQFAFMVIASDPERLRPMMIPAMIEKFIYVLTLVLLVLSGRLAPAQSVICVPDALLGVLFVAAFLKTRPAGGAICLAPRNDVCLCHHSVPG
jgi:hypothetical protein